MRIKFYARIISACEANVLEGNGRKVPHIKNTLRFDLGVCVIEKW